MLYIVSIILNINVFVLSLKRVAILFGHFEYEHFLFTNFAKCKPYCQVFVPSATQHIARLKLNLILSFYFGFS